MLLSLGLVAMTFCGCSAATTHERASAPESAAVRIGFRPAQAVEIRADDSTVVLVLRELTGRVASASSDSLLVEVTDLLTEAGTRRAFRGVAMIRPSEALEVEVLSRHPGLVNTVGILAIPVFLLGVLLYAGAAL